MIDGYYDMSNEDDVIAYIADVLQPPLTDGGVPLQYVYINHPRYEIFVILQTEVAGYAALTYEQKLVLAKRNNDWVDIQQKGGDPFTSDIKALIITTQVSAKINSLFIMLTNVDGGVEIDNVEWFFEKATQTSDFNDYKTNAIPDDVHDAAPNTVGNADVIFDNGDWLKYNWTDSGSEAQTGSVSNLMFGYAGAQGATAKQILVKVKVRMTNRTIVEGFGFVTIPAAAEI